MAARSIKSSEKISFTGPFFTKDPTLTFRANARRMERGLSLEGQRAVQEALEATESSRAPISDESVEPRRVSGHVRAGVPHSPGGKGARSGPILVNIYVLNKGFSKAGGTSLMAAYSRVEAETHAFRRVTAALRRSRHANVEELLKGLN